MAFIAGVGSGVRRCRIEVCTRREAFFSGKGGECDNPGRVAATCIAELGVRVQEEQPRDHVAMRGRYALRRAVAATALGVFLAVSPEVCLLANAAAPTPAAELSPVEDRLIARGMVSAQELMGKVENAFKRKKGLVQFVYKDSMVVTVSVNREFVKLEEPDRKKYTLATYDAVKSQGINTVFVVASDNGEVLARVDDRLISYSAEDADKKGVKPLQKDVKSAKRALPIEKQKTAAIEKTQAETVDKQRTSIAQARSALDVTSSKVYVAEREIEGLRSATAYVADKAVLWQLKADYEERYAKAVSTVETASAHLLSLKSKAAEVAKARTTADSSVQKETKEVAEVLKKGESQRQFVKTESEKKALAAAAETSQRLGSELKAQESKVADLKKKYETLVSNRETELAKLQKEYDAASAKLK